MDVNSNSEQGVVGVGLGEGMGENINLARGSLGQKSPLPYDQTPPQPVEKREPDLSKDDWGRRWAPSFLSQVHDPVTYLQFNAPDS